MRSLLRHPLRGSAAAAEWWTKAQAVDEMRLTRRPHRYIQHRGARDAHEGRRRLVKAEDVRDLWRAKQVRTAAEHATPRRCGPEPGGLEAWGGAAGNRRRRRFSTGARRAGTQRRHPGGAPARAALPVPNHDIDCSERMSPPCGGRAAGGSLRTRGSCARRSSCRHPRATHDTPQPRGCWSVHSSVSVSVKSHAARNLRRAFVVPGDHAKSDPPNLSEAGKRRPRQSARPSTATAYGASHHARAKRWRFATDIGRQFPMPADTHRYRTGRGTALGWNTGASDSTTAARAWGSTHGADPEVQQLTPLAARQERHPLGGVNEGSQLPRRTSMTVPPPGLRRTCAPTHTTEETTVTLTQIRALLKSIGIQVHRVDRPRRREVPDRQADRRRRHAHRRRPAIHPHRGVAVPWETSDRRFRLPKNWLQLKQQVKARAHGLCEAAPHDPR